MINGLHFYAAPSRHHKALPNGLSFTHARSQGHNGTLGSSRIGTGNLSVIGPSYSRSSCTVFNVCFQAKYPVTDPSVRQWRTF